MAYEVLQKVQTQNRSGKKLAPQGIVLHETATPGATAESESKYFDRTIRKSSVHYFIGWDAIIQKIPIFEVAWHAGPTANYKYIGIELCHAKTKEQFQEVWNRGVWLFAWLFVNYLKIDKVTKQNLPSHHDCTIWWHETTHVDPDGYFKEFGKTVDDFRKDVQKEIDKMKGGK
jgi:N-acetylmuramoyl-L-alanine amidase